MMHFGLNVLSGQIHGQVDWIAREGDEVGAYLHTPGQIAVRAVLVGDDIRHLTANQVVQRGMRFTACGELMARSRVGVTAPDQTIDEVLCNATRVLFETVNDRRIPGSVHALFKGCVMHWDPKFEAIKAYINFDSPLLAPSMTVSVRLKNWLAGLSPEGRLALMAKMAPGREFTCSGLAGVSSYQGRAGQGLIPSINMTPADFILHY